MATGLEYMIRAAKVSEYHFEYYYGWRYTNFVRYGHCTETPYIQNNLWFVTITRGVGKMGHGGESIEELQPEEDHTFLVDKQYAHPSVIQEWKRDIAKWEKVAYKVFVGFWCERYECLWKDVPVYELALQSGVRVKYGYCRTQSENPDRELWYVSFESGSTFVVDRVCATSDFINQMGNDILKWIIICWCHLEHEVKWDQLETGTLEGGYVRSSRFALDSPYVPDSTDEIEERIKNYETVVKTYEKRRKKTDPEWASLETDFKANLLAQIGKQVLGKSAMPSRNC